MDEKIQLSSSPAAPANEPATGMDVELLTRKMTKGDEMAWRVFYDQYYDRLWRYLLVCAKGNEDIARETLQTALLRLARHIKVFADEGVFWSWLTVLARSAFADETKKQRRYFAFLDRFRRHSEIQRESSGDELLDTLLRRQLAFLPPDEQQLIEQKYFAGRSVREIAVELKVSEKAVESKLTRIRKMLKEQVLRGLTDEAQE